MAEYKKDIPFELWKAMEAGECTSFIFDNDEFYQKGDTVTFRRLSKYNTGLDRPISNSFGTFDLEMKLGFSMYGVKNGLGPDKTMFCLTKVEEATG